MKQEQDPREIALEKFILIAPLLEPGIDKAELQFRRQKIVSDYSRFHFGSISERTIRRYLESYRKEGFQGLYPKQREDAGKSRVLTEDIMDAAAILKQELPQRSVRQIIEILDVIWIPKSFTVARGNKNSFPGSNTWRSEGNSDYSPGKSAVANPQPPGYWLPN